MGSRQSDARRFVKIKEYRRHLDPLSAGQLRGSFAFWITNPSAPEGQPF